MCTPLTLHSLPCSDPATCSADGSPSFSQLYCASFGAQGKSLLNYLSSAVSEFFFGPGSDTELEPNGRGWCLVTGVWLTWGSRPACCEPERHDAAP
jgi:hypothetical protein